MSPQAPGRPDSWPRRVAFGAGCVLALALAGLAIGSVCIASAIVPGGSGEWEGAGQVAALVLQVPAGLAVLALAFSQPRGRRRSLLRLAAAVILLMPIATVGLRHARAAWSERGLGRSEGLR